MDSEQFVSYAQNYEDVMLWRALKDVKQGFYVDVGANDPKFDSVTQAFYERGWRGINVEPTQSYYEALCDQRPRDINLSLAVGATAGELTFFEVSETGISSVIPDVVFQNKFLSGREVVERKVFTTTLNKIFEDYVRGPVHFLKIDVEGYEKAVLEGVDLRKWRPWILVIEATVPNSPEKNYDVWEPLVVSASYIFVYFDGLNRYYVAKEHSELLESFTTPPNVFDGFITVVQFNAIKEIQHQASLLQENQVIKTTIRNELDGKRMELESARKEIDALRSELDWARTDLNYLRKEIDIIRNELVDTRAKNESMKKEHYSQEALKSELEHVRGELRKVQTELEAKRAEVENFKKEYLNVLYSRSYRITAPLRSVYIIAQKMRHRTQQMLHRSGAVKQDKNISLMPSPTKTEELEDQQYFLDFFQREISHHQKILDKSQQ